MGAFGLSQDTKTIKKRENFDELMKIMSKCGLVDQVYREIQET